MFQTPRFFEDVCRWHLAMGHPVEGRYSYRRDWNGPSLSLGKRLVDEEYQELTDAWHFKQHAKVVDSIVDLIWVLCGLAARMGVDLDAVWLEVRAANWRKLDGPVRADGKRLKPKGWRPPKVMQAVRFGRNLKEMKAGMKHRWRQLSGKSAVKGEIARHRCSRCKLEIRRIRHGSSQPRRGYTRVQIRRGKVGQWERVDEWKIPRCEDALVVCPHCSGIGYIKKDEA